MGKLTEELGMDTLGMFLTELDNGIMSKGDSNRDKSFDKVKDKEKLTGAKVSQG